MNTQSRTPLWMFVATLWIGMMLPVAMSKADPSQATNEIEHLLEFVASSGCTFHRNGSDHDSVDAADHMRLKYSRGKRYADTAEHFIDRLASKSSWTGKPYTVTCSNQTEPSGDWLSRELKHYRSTSASSATGKSDSGT